MQPQLNLNGLFIFLASAVGAISFAVAVVVLAMSRDRWETFNEDGRDVVFSRCDRTGSDCRNRLFIR